MNTPECQECGERHTATTPCRTPAEILADGAPTPGYTDLARAQRAASTARADAAQARITASPEVAALAAQYAADMTARAAAIAHQLDLAATR